MKRLAVSCLVVLLLVGLTVSPLASGKREAGTADRSLIVYTNSGTDGRADWATELAREQGFEITVVHMPGGDLVNRILAEKHAQIADMVWGLNALEYERLKREDLLLKYEPVWAKEVDMVLGDSEGYYYPIVVQPLVLAYNADFVPSASAPRDWTELGTRFPGRYQIHNLGGGTSRSILASILVRYPDSGGVLGISKQGWEMARTYLGNAHYIQEGEDYWGNLVRGDKPLLMIWGSGFVLAQKNLNRTFNVMQPEVGVPFVVEQLAVFRNSRKTELAKEYIDWFGSAEIQTRWAQKWGSTPAHPVALQAAPEDVRAFMALVKPQSIDWKQISHRLHEWVEKAELELVP